MPIRRPFFAALAVTIALGVGAPAAGASAFPGFAIPTGFTGTPGAATSLPLGACGHATSVVGQGDLGSASPQVCQGAGLSFIGPSIGQVASVIGPTIIGPGVVGTVIVSAGNGAGVP